MKKRTILATLLSSFFVYSASGAAEFKGIVFQFETNDITKENPKYIISSNSGTTDPEPPLDFSDLTETIIIEDDPTDYNDFGTRVAYENNLLYITAPRHDLGGASIGLNYGGVYEYNYNGTDWEVVNFIESPMKTKAYEFGRVLVLKNDEMFSSLNYSYGQLGNESYFTYHKKEGGSWVHKVTVKEPRSIMGTTFGNSMDYNGNILAVGDYGFDDQYTSEYGRNEGAVYVYKKGSGDFSEYDLISPSYLGAGATFGSNLAIIDGRVVVYMSNAPGVGGNKGGLIVFENQGGTWVQTQVFSPSVNNSGSYFGQKKLLVDGNFLYTASTDGLFVVEMVNGQLVERKRIYLDLEGNPLSNNHFFWHTMDIEGDTLIAGEGFSSTVGTIFRFEKKAGSSYDWEFKERIQAKNPVSGDSWGGSVALGGGRMFSGADTDRIHSGGTNRGAVFVYSNEKPEE